MNDYTYRLDGGADPGENPPDPPPDRPPGSGRPVPADHPTEDDQGEDEQ